jgi:hypothetical protein
METRRSFRRRQYDEEPFFDKFKECVRQFIAFLFSNVGIVLLVVGYTIAGEGLHRRDDVAEVSQFR